MHDDRPPHHKTRYPNEGPLDDSAPRVLDDDGMPIEAWRCRAKSKSTGERCKRWRKPGKRVCKKHGGVNPGGPLKHGRRSWNLGNLQRAYRRAEEDQELLDLRRPIAALDAVVQRNAERMSKLDTGEFRERALHLYREAVSAQQGGDAERAASMLGKLGRLLRDGAAEDKAMETFAKDCDRLARRIEGAWGVHLSRQQAINARDLTVVMAQLVGVVRSELDSDVAAKVIAKLDATLSTGGMLEAAARPLERAEPAQPDPEP